MNQNDSFVFNNHSNYACYNAIMRKKAIASLRERLQNYACAIIFLQKRLKDLSALFDIRNHIDQTEYTDIIACVVTLGEYLKRYHEKITCPTNPSLFRISFPLPLVVALKKANRHVTHVSCLLEEQYLANENNSTSTVQLQKIIEELENLYIVDEDVLSQTRFLIHRTHFQEKVTSSLISLD